MGYAIKGQVGAGTVDVYTLSRDESISIGTVRFTLDADNSGNGHSPEVLFSTPDGDVVSRVPDWNDVADGSTVTYTFGVGLTPFCGVTNSGGAVQNDLPMISLAPGCIVTVRSLDSGGAVVTGDRISSVWLWAEDAAGASTRDVPLYTYQPFESQVA